MQLINLDKFENIRSEGKENIIAIYDEKTGRSYFAVVNEDEKELSNKDLFKRFCEQLFKNLENVNIRKYWNNN